MIEKVLIAGGTGYVGSRLAYDLARQGYRVAVLGRFDPTKDYPGWSKMMDQILLGDIRDDAVLNRLVEGEHDAIINLISLGPYQPDSSPEMACALDVLPTWNLLKRAADRGLQRFVYFSTQRVFDGVSTPQIDELTPVAPTTQYGLTHVLAEQVVDYFRNTTAIETVNARLASIYGSPQLRRGVWNSYIINQMCCMAHQEHSIQLRSDGSLQRDFIHMSDVSRFVQAVLGTKTLDERLYNVASGQSYSVLAAAHRVAAIYRRRTGHDVTVLMPDGQVSTGPKRIEHSARHGFSTARMCAVGCEPRISLDDGIDEVVAYLDANS